VFTGIVEEIGVVRRIERRSRGGEIAIAATTVLGDLKPGDSVCVSGACLTVVRVGSADFTCDLSEETLARTKLGGLRPSARVNLERAALASTRMGGHLVLGHVDGVGEVAALTRGRDGAELIVRFPADLAPFIVDKGSIAVDGISLTPFDVRGDRFTVALIPTTLAETTIGSMRAHDPVNLETDIAAKYAAKNRQSPGSASPGVTWDLLRDAGFTD